MDMLLHRRMLVLVLGTALALAAAFVLPRNSSAAPPEFGETEEYTIEGACDFPVLITVTPASRGTVRELPGGITLVAGRAISTFTNLDDPENQVTDVGGGSAFVSLDENGDLLVVARGHTGLIVPDEGIFLTRGRVTITVEPPGIPGLPLTILENQGRLIDVCARLA
jgi:hypothetical protein